jgi:uncharacterized membrane protein YvbJ
LRLIGKAEIKPKRWMLIASIVVLVLLLTPFGFKWYAYVHSSIYTAKTFVKAIMNGDEKTIDHLNYTDKHEQTIKKAWVDKLKGYNLKDLVYSMSDSYDNRIHVTTAKNKDLDLVIDVVVMNDSYYVTYVIP